MADMTRVRRRAWAILGAIVLVLSACGTAGPGAPQQSAPGSVGASAARPSIDQLVEAAKKEGKVVVYTARTEAQAQGMAKAFEAKYGIPVEYVRAGGEQLAQKLELELRAGRVIADVVHDTDRSYPTILKGRGDLLQYRPVNAEPYLAKDKDPEGYWWGSSMSGMMIIYNKSLVTPQEAPKSFKELADAKWKGKSVTGSPNYGGAQLAITKALLEMYGWPFLEQWRANNVMVVQGFPDAENKVISGERPVGVDVSTRLSEALSKGQPLGVVWPDEGFVENPDALFIPKGAPHPNAAKLYVEFQLSEEGSRIAVETGRVYSLRPNSDPPPHLPRLETIKRYNFNTAELVQQRDDIKRRWTDLMGT